MKNIWYYILNTKNMENLKHDKICVCMQCRTRAITKKGTAHISPKSEKLWCRKLMLKRFWL